MDKIIQFYEIIKNEMSVALATALDPVSYTHLDVYKRQLQDSIQDPLLFDPA